MHLSPTSKLGYLSFNITCTGHVTPSRHTVQTWGRPVVVLSIDVERHTVQTWGRPVVVLSIDVEHHTGIHNYLFICLRSDPN